MIADEAVCQTCGRKYPVQQGILIMEPDEAIDAQAETLQKQEEATRDAQAKFYDFWLQLHIPSRIERGWVRKAVGDRKPATAIEVGCGTGRWTRFLAKDIEQTVALDRSFRSLLQNQAQLTRLGLQEKVLLVKGDATNLPAQSGAFDAVFSGQLIEHLPTQALRDHAVAAMARVLKPGGLAVVSGYQWTPWNPLVRNKEGLHAGGMYYYRFSPEEFKDMLSRHFGPTEVRSSMGHILVGETAR